MDFFKKLASNLLDDQEHFTDLTQVAVVDAESCISVLSKRYEKAAVYTHCGPLLVAVNPYKRMPDLDSEDRLDEYAQLVPADAPAPHRHGAGTDQVDDAGAAAVRVVDVVRRDARRDGRMRRGAPPRWLAQPVRAQVDG